MMSFTPKPFKPPIWLKNAHLQTILPKYTVSKTPTYRRELVYDSRQESQVAYDFYDAKESLHTADDHHIPLLVLFHGMEGSSQSHYACSLANHAHNMGWHFVVVHFRSCGGVAATGKVFYHAGDTDEIHHVLSRLTSTYSTVYAVGTSLGGSVLAKYMGDYTDAALCQKAVVVSAPLDLASSSVAMRRFVGRKIYTPYLLTPIVTKALEQNLSTEEVAQIKASRSICEFDHVFTAPRHGYRSKNEYYHQASALPVLHQISKPTLIVTAKDDPFLGVIPTTADVSDTVVLCETTHGGHIGFIDFDWPQKRFHTDWYTHTITDFLKQA